jgi:YVTN family beta-propeller protein
MKPLALVCFLPILLLAQSPTRPVETVMDDPLAEQRLNREIWEASTRVPYSQVESYVKMAQGFTQNGTPAQLPTGWTINPAGTQVPVGTLPFEAVPFAGSTVVVNTGWASGPQSFSVVNPATGTVTQTVNVQTLFPSAASGPAGDLYISGGRAGVVYRYNAAFQLVQTYTIPGYVMGIAALNGSTLVVTYTSGEGVLTRPGRIGLLDVAAGTLTRTANLTDYEPYSATVLAGKIYVTTPALNRVDVLDLNLNPVGVIAVGEAPQTACVSGSDLLVVNANSDTLSVISTATDSVKSTISVRFKGQDIGSAPTSCAADDSRLYVTLASINAVAVLDKAGVFQGYIPTGWYSTKVLAEGSRLQVLSAKGIVPRRPNPAGQYVLSQLQGTLGLVDKSSISASLAGWTAQVEAGSPLTNPSTWTGGRQIEHIFYVVKENRTYDQVLGDLPAGNTDPSLTIFGFNVTPVQHYLAQEFVNLDNFFVTGEVSTTGHTAATSGFVSPYMQMLTGLEYSGRLNGSSNLFPGAFSPKYLWDRLNDRRISFRVYGELVYFEKLYDVLFGNASAAVTSKLNYLASKDEKMTKVFRPLNDLFAGHAREARTPAGIAALLRSPSFGIPFSRFFTGDDSLYRELGSNQRLLGELVQFLSRWSFEYRPFDQGYSDLDRIATWQSEFQARDAAGTVEKIHIMNLPNDHTSGNDPNSLTPAQFVAQNDAALDILIRTLAASRIWDKSLVLVVEDDAQDGPDHVDSTRTIAFAAGPWVKRQTLVSEVYDQTSMVRTIGMLLGAAPVGMNDALAVPMASVFTNQPNLTYNPPPVSPVLIPVDQARYQELLALIGPAKR